MPSIEDIESFIVQFLLGHLTAFPPFEFSLELPDPRVAAYLAGTSAQPQVVTFLQRLTPVVTDLPDGLLFFMAEGSTLREHLEGGVLRLNEFRAVLRGHHEAPTLSQFSRPDPFSCWPNLEEPPPALGEWMDDWDGNGMNRRPPLPPGEAPPDLDPDAITLQVHISQCPLASSCGLGHWSLVIESLVDQDNFTMYRVNGHYPHYSLQIISNVSRSTMQAGELAYAGMSRAPGLRTWLASRPITQESWWNSQCWVFDTLRCLIPQNDRNNYSLQAVVMLAWYAGEESGPHPAPSHRTSLLQEDDEPEQSTEREGMDWD